MEKILDIIEAISLEKNISQEHALEAFKEAIVRTAKKLTSRTATFEVIINRDEKTYSVNSIITVVEDDDNRLEEEEDSYISLSEAKDFDETLEIGDELKEEFILEEYGRTASANLFRELEYHIQRRIEQDILLKYQEKLNTILIGTVISIDSQNNTFIEIDELKGVLSQRNRIKGEKFKKGDQIHTLLRHVEATKQKGLHLELTRTSPKFLEELMKQEVPEIADGLVEVTGSARIPGERAKIALKTEEPRVDPIGAAVGVKGVRINSVSKELSGENIDCIEYSPIPEVFVTRSLSPAVAKYVQIDKENQKAKISITSDQKAKAIGRSGINIRLASMLTGYTIELVEVEGVSPQAKQEKRPKERTKDTSELENLFK